MAIGKIVPGSTNGVDAAASINEAIDAVEALPTGNATQVVSFDATSARMKTVAFSSMLPAALTSAQAAGTASIRAIGTTATTAAAGNHTHGAATGTAAGFMAAADKTKLDGLLPFKLAAAKPATPTSPGTQWEVFIDGEEFFLCIAPNVWRMWTLMSWGG